MWVAAALFALAQAFEVVPIFMRFGAEMPWYDWGQAILTVIRHVFFFDVVFVGLGVLIEMVDGIRWDALSAEDRVARRSRRSLWQRIRHWPDE
jgi:hypothetical protein